MNTVIWVMDNVDMLLLMLAFLCIVAERLFDPSLALSEIAFRWIAFFSMGLASLYSGILHLYFPHFATLSLHWPHSLNQTEVGVVECIFGVLGLVSCRADFELRLAAVAGCVIIMWGDALGHLYQVLQAILPVNELGSWFVMDAIVPFILIVCLYKLRPS